MGGAYSKLFLSLYLLHSTSLFARTSELARSLQFFRKNKNITISKHTL